MWRRYGSRMTCHSTCGVEQEHIISAVDRNDLSPTHPMLAPGSFLGGAGALRHCVAEARQHLVSLNAVWQMYVIYGWI